MLQFRQISKRSKSINFRKVFRNWKCQLAKNWFDHTRLYQWENYMHNLSKQYVSLYNRKWIIFLRAFIHWILKQKVIYEIGESGCEAIRTEIVFELLPITVIFDSQKTKYLTLFPSSEKAIFFIWLHLMFDTFLYMKTNTIITIQTWFKNHSSKANSHMKQFIQCWKI